MRNKLAYLVLLSSCWLAQGCSSASDSAADQHKPALADPSIAKCQSDGYQVQPVLSGGVVSRYLCINPQSKRKCDSWQYFRGECRLDSEPQPTMTETDLKLK